MCAVFVVRLRSASLSGRAWFAFACRIEWLLYAPTPMGSRGVVSASSPHSEGGARGDPSCSDSYWVHAPLAEHLLSCKAWYPGGSSPLKLDGSFLLFWDSFLSQDLFALFSLPSRFALGRFSSAVVIDSGVELVVRRQETLD